jgi:hypothetical protein
LPDSELFTCSTPNPDDCKILYLILLNDIIVGLNFRQTVATGIEKDSNVIDGDVHLNLASECGAFPTRDLSRWSKLLTPENLMRRDV